MPILSPIVRPRRCMGLFAACAGVAMLLASGCGDSATPPRSPFDDRGAAPTTPPGVTNFPPPFPPPLLTPTAGATGASGTPPASSPSAGDREAATGTAIEALANRMAIAATRITVVSADRMDWPNACLGAELPGASCAQVVTPGYRIVLRYDTGSTHEVRTGGSGGVAWVPQTTVRATVQQPERTNSALAVTGEGGRALSVLLAPGTQRIDLPIGSLKAGDRVIIGVDDVKDGSPLRAVWIAKDGN